MGCDPEDQRFPHVYTTLSPISGSACAIFPCIDDVHERCTWDLEITVPRTLGDIRRAARGERQGERQGEANGGPISDLGLDELDEFSDLDLVVVCSGDLQDEVCPWD